MPAKTRRRVAVLLAAAGAALAPGALAAPAQAGSFRSPSGNIGCVILSDYARCDVRARTFHAPARPASCDLEYGDAIGVGRKSRRGSFVCHGDTARDPRARKLAYGRSISVGSMRCTSSTAGIRCANRSGHGFFVARERYELF